MMTKRASEQGSALMMVTIMGLILVGISGAYLSISSWNLVCRFSSTLTGRPFSSTRTMRL